MKIIFLGTLYNIAFENEILENCKTGLQNQANGFQWSIIQGIEKNMGKSIDILNVIPVGTFPKHYTKLLLKGNRWAHSKNSGNIEVGSFNLPLIKQLSRFIKTRIEVRKWVKKSVETNNHIIVYSTYLPFLLAIVGFSSKVKKTIIVTDLPEFEDLTISKSLVKKVLRKMYAMLVYKLLNQFDFLVLLTNQMKDIKEFRGKPFVVIEGLINVDNIPENIGNLKPHLEKKIILYSGTLNYKYGVMTLIEAFRLIDKNDYELWICGSGEASLDIQDHTNKDSRIKFFGFISSFEVRKLQSDATVLVNPRSGDDEYTKYSFPSKTMEYMLSGKPIVAYKLPGIPDEYDQFISYVEGKEVVDLTNKLMEVCEKSDFERKLMGERAKFFVFHEKNNIAQTKKILSLIGVI